MAGESAQLQALGNAAPGIEYGDAAIFPSEFAGVFHGGAQVVAL